MKQPEQAWVGKPAFVKAEMTLLQQVLVEVKTELVGQKMVEMS